MVVFPKSWLASSPVSHEPGTIDRDLQPSDKLGILSFEAAATMSQLVSLHQSLSDARISKLRSDTMRSQGVAYLNSKDQALLLRLACAELMEELEHVADTISRFSLRCNGTASLAHDFTRVYVNLKSGSTDIGKLEHPKLKKMEKLIVATAKLGAEMEALEELEASERKMEKFWGRLSGPIPKQPQLPVAPDDFRVELKTQRQIVRRLKEESLWNKSFDKAVTLMARSACALFIRICTVFGPFVSGLPAVHHVSDRNRTLSRFRAKFSSGPIMERRDIPINIPMSSSCPIFGSTDIKSGTNWKEILEAPPDTVGAAGLTLRYANVILTAERLLQMEAEGREDEVAAEREEMYNMLPVALKSIVRSKLRDWWRNPGPLDQNLAEGWKEAAGSILAWLSPVARDTERWYNERSMDRKRRFVTGPRALMLHTLHMSNKAKVEAAIAELLVGLSCLCWYEERRQGSFRFF
ncbi:hypothetical protein LUZ61_007034 [Rhynchospora tenuis]|uniref:Uncharacterized protein n=1 Tax=Rhynchospora tenuis TaxID=198213 RepID=A0AAD6EW76_9POAL|nr:hypothetical protein LUZ61_007034 [Rhynchospora tenuis]